jgi:HEAT repeat protein
MTRRDHTFHVACAAEPARVEVDPHGDLLATFKLDQPTKASRATLASDAPLIARIRAAHALVDEPTQENVAALAAQLPTAFWALASECAKALGAMRTPAARDVLIQALAVCEQPKARRGIATALGSFRHDAEAGAALRALLEAGDPSLFVEAAAATALGQTRIPEARTVLEAALETKDGWAETIRIGIIGGLAALGDEAVVPAITGCTAYGRHQRLRAAAIRALGTVGKRMVRREAVLETLADRCEESDLRIVIAAAAALRTIGDPRGIAMLGGAPARHPDGRVRREAKAASLRLGTSEERSTEVSQLSDEVEKLRKQSTALLDRMEKLEVRLSTVGGDGSSARTPSA